MRTDCGRMER